MPGLRVALFVEGSTTKPARGGSPLEAIWQKCLAESLGLRRLDPIIPINKKHLVALDPRKPRMSGGGEALDQLIVRMLKRTPFDAAIVAWDLVPAWNPEGSFCRWEETVDLYRFLSASPSLPEIWRQQAERRLTELQTRTAPSERTAAPRLQPGMLLAVCMEPMFEALLVQDESAVRRALGIRKAPRDWPARGWGEPQVRRPDMEILGPAIRALLRVRPKPEVLRKVHGDLITHKNEWGELLLRRLLEDDRARPVLLRHPIARRLQEIASR
jgi:hypothetical protein